MRQQTKLWSSGSLQTTVSWTWRQREIPTWPGSCIVEIWSFPSWKAPNWVVSSWTKCCRPISFLLEERGGKLQKAHTQAVLSELDNMSSIRRAKKKNVKPFLYSWLLIEFSWTLQLTMGQWGHQVLLLLSRRSPADQMSQSPFVQRALYFPSLFIIRTRTLY